MINPVRPFTSDEIERIATDAAYVLGALDIFPPGAAFQLRHPLPIYTFDGENGFSGRHYHLAIGETNRRHGYVITEEVDGKHKIVAAGGEKPHQLPVVLHHAITELQKSIGANTRSATNVRLIWDMKWKTCALRSDLPSMSYDLVTGIFTRGTNKGYPLFEGYPLFMTFDLRKLEGF